MGTRKSTDRTVATAEAGQVTLQLAHHWTDRDGIVGEAGTDYKPGDPLTVAGDLARQLASAGLVSGVDPFEAEQVAGMLEGAAPAAVEAPDGGDQA